MMTATLKKKLLYRKKQGFTMPELLVALALIATLSAMTIPAFIQNGQGAARRSCYKEIFRIFQDLEQQGMVNGDLNPGNASQYFIRKMRASSRCYSNSLSNSPGTNPAGPCWDSSQGSGSSPYNLASSPGVVLQNGATIVGLGNGINSGNTWYNDILIDWNGKSPPNQVGQDQIYVQLCYGTTPCGNQQPGSIAAAPLNGSSGANNAQSFRDLMSQ